MRKIIIRAFCHGACLLIFLSVRWRERAISKARVIAAIFRPVKVEPSRSGNDAKDRKFIIIRSY